MKTWKQSTVFGIVAIIAFGFVFIGCPNNPETKTYTVTFNADNGTENTNQNVTEGGKATKPTEPAKDGYIFSYWFNVETDVEWDFNTIVTKNINLKAKWIIPLIISDFYGIWEHIYPQPNTFINYKIHINEDSITEYLVTDYDSYDVDLQLQEGLYTYSSAVIKTNNDTYSKTDYPYGFSFNIKCQSYSSTIGGYNIGFRDSLTDAYLRYVGTEGTIIFLLSSDKQRLVTTRYDENYGTYAVSHFVLTKQTL